MSLRLVSLGFPDGGQIPPRFARTGENLSPALEWRGQPAGTKSFVLLVEDPDAPSGTYRHWGVYDIPPTWDGVPEGFEGSIAGVSLAVNDDGNAGYDGPHPPKGHGVHHYHFRLAALDTDALDVPASPSVADVWSAAEPHVLETVEIVGTFERR